jgi:hypothetical protein
LQEISPALGQLVLEDVTLTTPAGRTSHLSLQAIKRDAVKSLAMLPAPKPSVPDVLSAGSDQTMTRKSKPKKGLPRHSRGSEADDSALTLEESSAKPSRRRSANGSAHASRRKSSNVTVSPPAKSFTEDFDFAGGLQSFDKKAVFQQIRDSDQTDPSLRLVAHNRKGGVDKYATKLGIHESVLDVEPLEPAPSSLMPIVALGDALTTESEAEPDTEDDPINGANAAAFQPILTANTKLPCPCLSWKEWKDVLQLANIELGPNSVQRIENAARGIAAYILSRMGKASPLNVVVLCGTGTKGQIGLRTGAHLINKGANVTALLISGETLWVTQRL